MLSPRSIHTISTACRPFSPLFGAPVTRTCHYPHRIISAMIYPIWQRPRADDAPGDGAGSRSSAARRARDSAALGRSASVGDTRTKRGHRVTNRASAEPAIRLPHLLSSVQRAGSARPTFTPDSKTLAGLKPASSLVSICCVLRPETNGAARAWSCMRPSAESSITENNAVYTSL